MLLVLILSASNFSSLLILKDFLVVASINMQILTGSGEGSRFGAVSGKGASAFHSISSVIFATCILLLLQLKREEIGMEGAGKENVKLKLPSANLLISIISTDPENVSEKQILFPNLPGTCPILQVLSWVQTEVISVLGRGAHIGLSRGKGNIDQKNLLKCILSSGSKGNSV